MNDESTLKEKTDFLRACVEVAAATTDTVLQASILRNTTSLMEFWLRPFMTIRTAASLHSHATRSEIDVLEVRLCEWLKDRCRSTGYTDQDRVLIRHLVEDLRGGTLWHLLKGGSL